MPSSTQKRETNREAVLSVSKKAVPTQKCPSKGSVPARRRRPRETRLTSPTRSGEYLSMTRTLRLVLRENKTLPPLFPLQIMPTRQKRDTNQAMNRETIPSTKATNQSPRYVQNAGHIASPADRMCTFRVDKWRPCAQHRETSS
jgi:hypothetical protein